MNSIYRESYCVSLIEYTMSYHENLLGRNAELEQRVDELEEEIEKQYNQFMEAIK